jgi:hypothetical protein
MTQQTLIKPRLQTPDPTLSSSAGDSLEGLLGRLVKTLTQQRQLRAVEGRWDDLAVVQSTLHELRAALAIERRRLA